MAPGNLPRPRPYGLEAGRFIQDNAARNFPTALEDPKVLEKKEKWMDATSLVRADNDPRAFDIYERRCRGLEPPPQPPLRLSVEQQRLLQEREEQLLCSRVYPVPTDESPIELSFDWSVWQDPAHGSVEGPYAEQEDIGPRGEWKIEGGWEISADQDPNEEIAVEIPRIEGVDFVAEHDPELNPDRIPRERQPSIEESVINSPPKRRPRDFAGVTWPADELERLAELAYREYSRDWEQISLDECLFRRSSRDCEEAFCHLAGVNITDDDGYHVEGITEEWTEEQDKCLWRWCEWYGYRDWTRFAYFLQKPSSYHCKYRFWQLSLENDEGYGPFQLMPMEEPTIEEWRFNRPPPNSPSEHEMEDPQADTRSRSRSPHAPSFSPITEEEISPAGPETQRSPPTRRRRRSEADEDTEDHRSPKRHRTDTDADEDVPMTDPAQFEHQQAVSPRPAPAEPLRRSQRLRARAGPRRPVEEPHEPSRRPQRQRRRQPAQQPAQPARRSQRRRQRAASRSPARQPPVQTIDRPRRSARHRAGKPNERFEGVYFYYGARTRKFPKV